MEKEHKIAIVRILLTIACTVMLLIFKPGGIAGIVLWLALYIFIGADVLYKAVREIFEGHVFDECFLMGIATLGAITLAFLGMGEFTEAVAVMLFYQIGELLGDIALDKSRDNIEKMMDIRPDYANIEENGILCRVSPSEVPLGSLIVVNPGERIPLDGVVESGSSSVDTSSMTGECLPRTVGVGEGVVSGCINLDGVIKVRTTKSESEGTVAKILKLVEEAGEKKAKSERFISKFSRIYTPAVCMAALLLALIPPLIILAVSGEAAFGIWTYRALSFLVVSCPCALVISVPLAFFVCLGTAGKRGILIKGSVYAEKIAHIERMAFDKTGTLTEGRFSVVGVYPAENITEAQLMEYAAYAESASSHPIAKAIIMHFCGEIDRTRAEDVSEISGKGVEAVVDGARVVAGNALLMSENDIKIIGTCDGTSVVYIGADGKYAGAISLSDKPKDGAAEVLQNLKKCGIKETVMLTGDRAETAERIGKGLGLDRVIPELLPHQKVEALEELMQGGGITAFAGDGINDAPVLMRSDVGIAMGKLGSDAAIEAADAVIMDDSLEKLVLLHRICKKCMKIVKENIILCIVIKLSCLVLGAFGIIGMQAAVFSDVGVMLLAVLNSLRVAVGYNTWQDVPRL